MQTVLVAIAMVKTTLALRENIIEVAVYLIKHTFFIDFRDKAKNVHRVAIL